jgi:hypothetical protein
MTTKQITMELLGRGSHASPGQGGNVLELASVLAGERWSARPESVHPALTAAADTVNDLLADERRRLLVPFAPWLLGTNTADARTWPAVARACLRAALASASGPDRTRLLADLDLTQQWLDGISSSCGGHGRQARRARRRDWKWAICASRSALVRVAAASDHEGVDATLCQVLLDCINECRRLAGEQAVDPRLPLIDCPQFLVVEPHVLRTPGCDWMDVGYQPVSGPQPADAPWGDPRAQINPSAWP